LRCRGEGEEGHHGVAGAVVDADGFEDKLFLVRFLVFIFVVVVERAQQNVKSFGGRCAAVGFRSRQVQRGDVVDEFILLVELFDHVFGELDGFEYAAGLLCRGLGEAHDLSVFDGCYD
jgi:hypothetical protein